MSRQSSRCSAWPKSSTTRRTTASGLRPRSGESGPAPAPQCKEGRCVTQQPPALVEAREQFLKMVDSLRPELHRYCARLTGSVIEGEDIVQEALAKAFYTLSLWPD